MGVVDPVAARCLDRVMTSGILLVQREHIDLLRVASAACPRD